MIQVSREAVARARAGDGPTMIEALTYRREGHSSSDDPSVYRDASEPDMWSRRDPLNRFRGYLKGLGLWSEKLENDSTEKHNAEITRVVKLCEDLVPPPVESLFDDVYEEQPWHIAEQREWLMSQPRTKSPHSH